jgi:hypothetical protein
MRCPASEKLEIIRIVEQSHLPGHKTLEQLDVPRRTFCRWDNRYLDGGPKRCLIGHQRQAEFGTAFPPRCPTS